MSNRAERTIMDRRGWDRNPPLPAGGIEYWKKQPPQEPTRRPLDPERDLTVICDE